ncbi:hypothetical protein [Rufibacter quisquiliarum]|uniref:Uncharacterized protein n=1 Tax=Rufibacter quisquiliarum TaxID=1549639 RepID=A0A839GNS2_9BACT|nr:hypothetical protein [Rufibacter quisquiliarum]MBA9076088.1 hypothetical protein [Rufibacter quisquiliarum]
MKITIEVSVENFKDEDVEQEFTRVRTEAPHTPASDYPRTRSDKTYKSRQEAVAALTDFLAKQLL